MITCEDCHKEISESAHICPHCGSKLNSTLVEKVIKFGIWYTIISLAIGLIGFIFLWNISY